MIGRLKDLQPKVQHNDWEKGFVESLLQQVNRGRTLSARQLEVFEKIESRYSAAVMAQKQKWIKQYGTDSSLREKARICAKYYVATGYFTGLAKSILQPKCLQRIMQSLNLRLAPMLACGLQRHCELGGCRSIGPCPVWLFKLMLRRLSPLPVA
jgi:hypothetical protein